MVFDVSERATFENIKKWHQEFRDYSSGTIELVLVGNKTDKERDVVRSEGQRLAHEIGAKYVGKS
jgi:Rab family protein